MLIKTLSEKTGVSRKAIRYYESIGLIQPPERGRNNYRQYTEADVERLRFIAGARSLGFSLSDVGEILAARDHNIAPCRQVLDTIDARLQDIDMRIATLLDLRETLRQLRQAGAALRLDDVLGENCICYLVKTYRDTGEVSIQQTALQPSSIISPPSPSTTR